MRLVDTVTTAAKGGRIDPQHPKANPRDRPFESTVSKTPIARGPSNEGAYISADMGAMETLRLVTRRSQRVIYRMALERFELAHYFVRTGSDGGSERRVRG